ncbi:hypothetical protein ONZ45_g18629 [Pleurotus djamor]|nr:hypothetical protein ONZ45_g18629 [Pleurotus djamor]
MDNNTDRTSRPQCEEDAGVDGIFWTMIPKTRNSKQPSLQRVKRCDRCQSLISLGDGSGLHAFHAHQAGQSCTKSAINIRATSAQKSVASYFKPSNQQQLSNSPAPLVSPISGSRSGSLSASPARSRSLSTDESTDMGSSSRPFELLSDDESGPSAGILDTSERWTPLATTTSTTTCPGIPFEFTDSIYLQYPWQLHHFEQLSYHFTAIEAKGTKFRIRSNECLGVPSLRKPFCSNCDSLRTSPEIERLRERAASQLPVTTNYRYYSFEQFCNLARSKNEQLNKLKLQHLNLSRKLGALGQKLDDHRLIMSIIAEKDIPGLQRLINVALKQNRSPSEIIRRLKRARDGLYRVKGFTIQDIDIATMGLLAGGPKLAYALAHALGLPSVRTLQSKLKKHRTIASSGPPTLAEGLHNMEGLKARTTAIGQRGYVLMVDECALEERPRFDSKRNAILGLCREHGSSVDSNATSLESIQEVRLALKEGTVHRAKEATVISVAPFSKTHYNPQPVIISGTCKTEKENAHAGLLRLAIRAFKTSPSGGVFGNKLFSIATDGDAVRRRSVHKICMDRTLDPSSPLYVHLSPLPLMNLQCGEDDLVADIDFKHLFKRIATGIRQKTGLLIGTSQVTPSMIKKAFCDYLRLDREAVETLFDPKDHQNVPKTNRMLKAIYDLSQLPDFIACITNRPIALLGQLVGSLILPFTNVNLSLREQLQSLSMAAHMTLALYRLSATSFVSGPLGYDIPTTCKAVYWCVAKQMVMDPSGVFYIGQMGSDRLEGDFGQYRTGIRGARNFDIMELADRATATQTLSEILLREFEWDRGHRRLKLEGAEGIDHTNPTSWKGDVSLESLSLLTCWSAGRRSATKILSEHGINVDFSSLESSPPGKDIDILHPRGSFVGLREETLEDSTPPVLAATPISDSPEAIDGDVSIDDVIPSMDDSSGSNTELDQVYDQKSMWLSVEGKSVHKASIVRCLLSSDDGLKSTDRLRRVRGYSKEPSSATLDDDTLLGDHFMTGHLVATFLRVSNGGGSNDLAALAIVRVTEITNPSGASLPSITSDGLANAKVTLTGQVLCLESVSSGSSLSWQWNGNYEVFPTLKTSGKKTAQTIEPSIPGAQVTVSKNSTVITFPATLCQPLCPQLIPFKSSVTWSFNREGLDTLCTALWDHVSGHRDKLLAKSKTSTFPYRNEDESFALINHQGTSDLQDTLKAGDLRCFLCGKVVTDNKMRDHVSRHILFSRFNQTESGLLQDPGDSHPCGYCGRSQTCSISLARSSKSEIPASNCPNYYKFSMKSALKPTKSGMSTNRPVYCPLCHERHGKADSSHIHWTYNLEEHLLAEHPGKDFDDDFREKIRITGQELGFLGVDAKKQATVGSKRKRGAGALHISKK